MSDDRKLDIRKVISDNARVSDVNSLANSGVKRVKVLDEASLQRMIEQAVDEVVRNSTAEERSRILADSRKQLSKLMNERDQSAKQANLAAADRNELLREIDKLQKEVNLRREVDEQQAALRSKTEELAGENTFLRENNDKIVEELERANARIKELEAEVARLRARLAELEDEVEVSRGAGETAAAAMRKELERVRAELAEAKGRAEEVEAESADVQESARVKILNAQAEVERLRQESEARAKEIEGLKVTLEKAASAEVLEEQPEYVPTLVLPSDEDPAKAPAEAKKPAPPPPPPPPPPATEIRAGKGLDVGTVNLVAAETTPDGVVEIRQQRNVFIDVEVTPFTKAMLTKLNVPYFMQNKRMFVIGEQAFELANVINRRTRRPMKDGLISAREQDALPVMKLLIGSILGEPRVEDEVCFYSVPGDPIDSDLSVAYHRDLFDAVLRALGYKPSHILEGHAVTFAELAEEDFTGIGVSCGGGMFNICVVYKSMPALTFSTARSGDWVDLNVAQNLNMKPEKAAQIKEQGLDLLSPKNREQDAISIYYRNLLQYNINNIAERFRSAENMPTFPEPISIVFSGGTALAGNFIELAKEVFKSLDFPIPIKDIRLAKDCLNATAKGALVAAQLEMASRPA
ncbi:MAG TPA: hypothetical protein VF950_02460 [Planctomycetota bacterium]